MDVYFGGMPKPWQTWGKNHHYARGPLWKVRKVHCYSVLAGPKGNIYLLHVIVKNLGMTRVFEMNFLLFVETKDPVVQLLDHIYHIYHRFDLIPISSSAEVEITYLWRKDVIPVIVDILIIIFHVFLGGYESMQKHVRARHLSNGQICAKHDLLQHQSDVLVWDCENVLFRFITNQVTNALPETNSSHTKTDG